MKLAVTIYLCLAMVSSAEDRQDPKRGRLLGCFEDSADRLLKTMMPTANDSTRKCLNACARNGYIYCGTQAGNQCFCGNIRPPSGAQKPLSDCNTPCRREGGKCGGHWRMNVYETGLSATPIRVPSRPVIPEADDDRVPEDHPNRSLLPADLAVRECGVNKYGRVMGDNVTDLGEYPWMANLEFELYPAERWQRDTRPLILPTFNCEGTLISNRYVLTPATCLNNNYFRLISVRLGEFNMKTERDCEWVRIDSGRRETRCADPVQNIGIEEMITHPSLKSETDFDASDDIALLRLDRPVTTNSLYISPICLPFYEWRTSDYTDSVTWVASFRSASFNIRASEPDMQLQERKLAVMSNQQCAQALEELDITWFPSYLCAGGQTVGDTCLGSSGSPIMAVDKSSPLYRIVGFLTSSVPDCNAREKSPALYIRVGSHLNWIMDNIRA